MQFEIESNMPAINYLWSLFPLNVLEKNYQNFSFLNNSESPFTATLHNFRFNANQSLPPFNVIPVSNQ